ncbi:hypothetical protein ACJ73_06084 [Blastomyces percursus]|uniref:Uncharacterized protein n=1 Tax=Blastomyces percursus TaxID=1658174 RepID=A0A1J9Q3A4_9EURO|nr:hypothetical protein ACJ73_06084 [Blastomyces percursus]
MGLLDRWLVDSERPTGSDHEPILFEWLDLNGEAWEPPTQATTGWRTQELTEDHEAMEQAARAWRETTEAFSPLDDTCTVDEVEQEAMRIQDWLTKVLNEHAKLIRLVARSKRWWGDEIVQPRQFYARERRAWTQGLRSQNELKEARKGLL